MRPAGHSNLLREFISRTLNEATTRFGSAQRAGSSLLGGCGIVRFPLLLSFCSLSLYSLFFVPYAFIFAHIEKPISSSASSRQCFVFRSTLQGRSDPKLHSAPSSLYAVCRSDRQSNAVAFRTSPLVLSRLHYFLLSVVACG